MGLDTLDGPGECEPIYQQMKNVFDDQLPKVNLEETKKDDVLAAAKNDVVMQVEEDKRPRQQPPVQPKTMPLQQSVPTNSAKNIEIHNENS